MPAPTKEVCLSIEDAVHPALFAQLQGFGIRPAIPLSKDDLNEIAVIPLFSLGASDGHKYPLPAGGWEYDMYPGSSIVVELSVPRFTKDPIVLQGVYTRLGQELSRIRSALSFNQGSSLNSRLLYHKLTHLVPAGTQLGFSEERGEDIATIAYRCTAGIRNDAWPLA